MPDTTDLYKARMAVGLSERKFADLGSVESYKWGLPIVCRCVHCDELFASRSYDIADQEYICKGDCGCTKPSST